MTTIASTDPSNPSPATPPEPKPASTVVLLRDSDSGLQTLLLKRNKALMFAGGFWVFPGGAIDQADMDAADGDVELASRIAARREAQEEADIAPDIEAMVKLSHWTTPTAEPRRFSTWFYAAPVSSDVQETIDGGEIHDSRWVDIDDALAAHAAGDFAILPPTFVTLHNLRHFQSVADFRAGADGIEPFSVMPTLGKDGDTLVTMYPGDAGYGSGDGGAAGPRHRLYLDGRQWRLCWEGQSGEYQPLMDSPQ